MVKVLDKVLDEVGKTQVQVYSHERSLCAFGLTTPSLSPTYFAGLLQRKLEEEVTEFLGERWEYQFDKQINTTV